MQLIGTTSWLGIDTLEQSIAQNSCSRDTMLKAAVLISDDLSQMSRMVHSARWSSSGLATAGDARYTPQNLQQT